MNEFYRGRRLRRNPVIREMVRETQLSAADLMMLYFVVDTTDEDFKKEIPSMPGQYQLSLKQLEKTVGEAVDAGLRSLMLFGIPKHKDAIASEAYAPNGIVQRAIRMLKAKWPDLQVVTDVCLCEYTSHGHCGILKEGDTCGEVVNDPTLELLAKTALSHVEAGADMVAPSDMMDGRILAIRETLDKAGYVNTPIMSYAVKYASAFYGPFRDAAESAPHHGDRKTYQMDPANAMEGLREAAADIDEGADIVMVKPAGPRTLEDGSPLCRLIAWEVTRSCNLACKHCRAEAHPEPYPGELSTEEAKALIDTFPSVGNPIIIFTGGDPMIRPDVYELIAYAGSKGLRCVMSPNGTLITPENARNIKEAGVQRCSISIDGYNAEKHDAFRCVPGAFDATMRGIECLKAEGVEFQINTTVTRDNLHDFKKIFELCERIGAAAWHIFLLVPMGRAAELADQVITAQEYEDVLHWFYDFRKTTSMHLKATCAPHYYRIMRQRAREEGVSVTPATFGMDAMTRGCLGGTGFCFISHVGQVQPCGYLTLDCGNVRTTPFPEIWRKSKPFLQFRDQSEYKGKCGVCEFHKVCGGCRARAWSMDGDYMGEEPLCTYQPRKAKEAE